MLAMLFTGVAQATTWLNIPEHYDKDGELMPSVSYPVSTWEKCSDAIVEYAKMEYVYYIGCDIRPLRDAVNINRRNK